MGAFHSLLQERWMRKAAAFWLLVALVMAAQAPWRARAATNDNNVEV